MKNYDVFKGPNALKPDDEITMTAQDLETKYVSRQAWDALRKDLDGYKALTDNLFDECLEALGTPATFSLLEVPWQLRTMRKKIDNLTTRLAEADTIYPRIIAEQKETIIGGQKIFDDLQARIAFLEGEIERLRPKWEGIPK